jgi:hypothetical protein
MIFFRVKTMGFPGGGGRAAATASALAFGAGTESAMWLG